MTRTLVIAAMAAALTFGTSAYEADDAEARPRPAGKKRRSNFEANKTFGLGIMLGSPTGLSGKYFTGPSTAIDFGIGGIGCCRGRSGIHIHADYLWHPLSIVSDPARSASNAVSPLVSRGSSERPEASAMSSGSNACESSTSTPSWPARMQTSKNPASRSRASPEGALTAPRRSRTCDASSWSEGRRRRGNRIIGPGVDHVDAASRRRSVWYDVAMDTPFARGKARKPIPGFVKTALAKHNLTDAFQARPEYQRNDYLTWLDSAKLPEQRQARLTQLVEELGKGDVYMGQPWAPPKPVTK